MKTSAKTGLLRRATALALAVVLSIPSAFAAAGDKKIQTSTQLVSGLSYQNTVTANNGSRVESFSLELEPGAAAQPILLQSGPSTPTSSPPPPACPWASSSRTGTISPARRTRRP